jgi:hypothetical protein
MKSGLRTHRPSRISLLTAIALTGALPDGSEAAAGSTAGLGRALTHTHVLRRHAAGMPKRENSENGPVTSFGVGGMLFDNAQRGVLWTAWRSVLVALIGLTGCVLGIAYASWGLAVVSGLVFLVAAVWMRSSVRSHRDAMRLERRAGRTSGE